jgi:hypothetical protein
MTHTPGPWDYVGPTEHHGPYITSEFGSTIADFYTMTLPNARSTANGGPSKPVHFMHEQAEHNARLASAAPDLLDALKSMTDLCRVTAIKAGVSDIMADKGAVFDRARAAIAKAEVK